MPPLYQDLSGPAMTALHVRPFKLGRASGALFKDDTLPLHRRRKIEIVMRAEDRTLIEDLLRAAGVSGWTMIRDVAGMGHHGFHQCRTIFNDESGLVMFVGVGDEAIIADVASGLSRLFERRPGVTFR
ncbi:MAG: P-II family nitrogen regulator [Sphingopyxis terrae]|nr:P-II family nitrogen regulator [Sphingopyxis terrae]